MGPPIGGVSLCGADVSEALGDFGVLGEDEDD